MNDIKHPVRLFLPFINPTPVFLSLHLPIFIVSFLNKPISRVQDSSVGAGDKNGSSVKKERRQNDYAEFLIFGVTIQDLFNSKKIINSNETQ